MILFPAIDLYEKKAVRLYRGDYREMTVYSEHPEEIIRDFISSGASHAHIVDLEGAKTGGTPNLETILKLREEADAAMPEDAGKRFFIEVGGGIRSMDVAAAYLDAGVDRVILGTAAVKDPGFLKEAVGGFGEKTAVGVDLRDGQVSVRGWTESAGIGAFPFFERLSEVGVSTVICTDVSKDGAMQGTNVSLYQELVRRFPVNLIASGGVSSLDDIRRLRAEGLYGAIVGKAYYVGAVDLKEAVRIAESEAET